MALSPTSFGSYNLCALEIIKNDECGLPEEGPANRHVMRGMTQVGITPVLSTPQEFERKNSCDELLYEVISCADPFKRQDLVIDIDCIDFCGLNLLTGVSLDNDGVDDKGFNIGQNGPCTNVSVRGWGLIPGDQCAGGVQEWAVFEWPQLVGTRINALGTIGLAAHTLQLTGRTQGAATGYGDGPLDMANSDFAAGTHFRYYRTATAPPASTDGCADYTAIP